MKILTLLLLSSWSYAQCPSELSKSHLLGKASNPTKFYTPIRSFCSDEILNVFSNCIEVGSSDKTIFFGSRDKHSEDQTKADCPNGYATEARNGFLKFQKLNGKPVCLNACDSIAIGKFFRDEEKFGPRKALHVGDQIYIPELKGLHCGEKTHDGCVQVSQFIEYTNDPVIDLYSGTCRNSINKGICSGSKDEKLPQTLSIYKVNTKASPGVSETQLSSEVQNNLLSF